MTQQVREMEAIADRVIGRSGIEASFEALRASVADPTNGIFGPGSVMWQLVEPFPVLPMMLVQAGLIELLAPKIFFGTEKGISRTGDYNPRFARSYEAFTDWFLGDVDTALRTARRVHGYHSRIGGHAPSDLGNVTQGQYYRATEEQLMVFTVGTQVMPLKQIYEQLVRPLTVEEATRYYEEIKRFAALHGVDPAAMPATWRDYEIYWQRCVTSGELELASDGLDRMGPFTNPQSLSRRARLAMNVVMTWQFNLLPGEIRQQYERQISVAKARPRTAKAISLTLRALLRVAPRGLTMSPRVADARRRVGSMGGQGRLEAWLRRSLPHPFGDAQPSMCTPSSPAADPRRSEALTQSPVP